MRFAPQEERTFFITTVCHQRTPLFRNADRALLLIDTLNAHRKSGRFLIHEFVIMPDHFHAIITPATNVPLEKAIQFIKGGFSFRVKRELGYLNDIWQTGFSEHRIKDAADYDHHAEYIAMNPVRAHLATAPREFPYSSASGNFELDPRPPWLKPFSNEASTRA